MRADARAERGGGIARRGCQHAGDELRVVFRVDAHMAVFGGEGTALQRLGAGLGRGDGHADGARGGGGGCARAGGRGQYVEKGVGTRGLDAHIARGDGAFPARLGDGGVFVHEHGDGAARGHGRARSQAHVRGDEREFGIVLRGEGKRAVCIDERMVAQRRLRARAGEDDVDAAADGRAARAGGHRVRRGHGPDVVLRGRLNGDVARGGHGACLAHAGTDAVAPLSDGDGRAHARLGRGAGDGASDDARGRSAVCLDAQALSILVLAEGERGVFAHVRAHIVLRQQQRHRAGKRCLAGNAGLHRAGDGFDVVIDRGEVVEHIQHVEYAVCADGGFELEVGDVGDVIVDGEVEQALVPVLGRADGEEVGNVEGEPVLAFVDVFAAGDDLHGVRRDGRAIAHQRLNGVAGVKDGEGGAEPHGLAAASADAKGAHAELA